MTHAPQRLDPPDPGTDGFVPVTTRARALGLPRHWLVLLAAVGVLAGIVVALRYSGCSAGEPASRLPLAGQLLRLGLPPQEEAGILFSATDAKPAANPCLLPAGLPAVYAFYEAPGHQGAGRPEVKWTRDGQVLPDPSPDDVMPEGNGKSGKILLRPPRGKVEAGVYEVELKLGPSNLAASFVAAWGAEKIASQSAPADAQVTISDLLVATAVSPANEPQHPQKSFGGRERIFAAFKFAKAEPGSAVVVKWYGGPEPITAATKEIVLPSTTGTASAWLQAPPGSPLPPGNYSVTVSMAGDTTALARAAFDVIDASLPGVADKKGGAHGSALGR